MKLNLIAGEWVGNADTGENLNPANLMDVVGVFTRDNVEQVSNAVEAADAAFVKWSKTSPQVRSDLLERIAQELFARKDQIGLRLSREEGKTLVEAVAETFRAAQIFRFFAGEALRITKDAIASVQHGSHSGMAMVSLPTAGVDYHVPFGGRKGSSYGSREQGRHAVEFYTSVKTTYKFAGAYNAS